MQIATELKQYLNLKKWQYRPTGDGKNIAIKTCPFCGYSKWKFYIHGENTKYRCWHGSCNAVGNLYKLKRDLGDLKNKLVSAASATGSARQEKYKEIPMERVEKFHRKLLKDKEARLYLKGRGFGTETIKHFKLGLRRKNGISWLAIPHINDEVCHNIKFRSMPPAAKRFERVTGCASVLYNEDALADHETIVLVEGEMDAMSFWEAGVKNVIGLTGGASSFPPEWYDLLAEKDEVILAMDADAVGQNGARDIARRIGFDRCTNVLLPVKDANEVLMEYGKVELVRSLQTKERFEVHGIYSLDQALQEWITQLDIGVEKGLHTPWYGVNRIIGKAGWQPGDLIVLSAKVKIGKTTFSLSCLKHWADQGHPTLMFCMEMGKKRLVPKLIAMHRKRDVDELQRIDGQYTRYHLRNVPFYFAEPEWGAITPDSVFTKIRESVKRYGIRALVFDNLHYLCRSLQHLTNEIGNVCRSFKMLAEELGITVILIAQPKKVGDKKIISHYDIKDSASIPADADQVIILHRDELPAGMLATPDDKDDGKPETNQPLYEPKMLVRSDASRYQAGGECYLYYQGETSLFYDWQDRPTKALPPM